MKKNFLSLLIIYSLSCYSQNKTIDSLKQLLSLSKTDTNKVFILGALSHSNTFSFADTAVIYAQQEIQLSKQLNFQRGEAFGMLDLAGALTTLGNYTAALDYSYRALAIFKELKDTFGIGNIYMTLSTCYREQGDYKQAVQNIQECFRLAKLSGGNYFNMVGIGGLLSSIYERSNELDSALIYGQKAYNVYPEWSGILTVLGAIHRKLKHNDLAIEFYRKAIPAAVKGNAQIDMLDAYNGISEVYLNERKIDSAIYYANQALHLQWSKIYPIGMLHATMLLANIYESENITDSTLKYLKLTINLKDSLFNQQKTREAQSFIFNEQLHQQELQQKLVQADIVYRNRLNIYFLSGGLIVLVIVIVGLWRRNIFKQKSFALLQNQKHETDIQKQKAEKALEELKSAQSQLIQSEKMASLGELTAGIAHEIQNPLNFVNNFSEVNAEMIDELKNELATGNWQLANEIANDIKTNEQKINRHGKRADAIVKSMLEHSKASTGIKEPTDINKLADEYLRLAYHGFRAKDKSFNAEMITDFDDSIGKINVVQQDIGRVLLNLYNNAFYACTERSRNVVNQQKGENLISYQPTVWVSTKKAEDRVTITVEDNGSGIPEKIKEKIFQPFFTTKPAGSGTGLGLSLSYDIVKAHGGEIKVESKEGDGSEFVITLPVT